MMNPYKILNLSKNHTKKDVINAMAQAMRKREYTAREIAEAQKELLNPLVAKSNRFIHFIDVDPLIKKIDLDIPQTEKDFNPELLSVFDDL